MKKLTIAAMIAAGLTLTACGGRGDDQLGDNVNDAYENRADALEQQADNLEDRAESMREEGERKEEAIDDADVNADAMNGQQQANVANAL